MPGAHLSSIEVIITLSLNFILAAAARKAWPLSTAFHQCAPALADDHKQP